MAASRAAFWQCETVKEFFSRKDSVPVEVG